MEKEALMRAHEEELVMALSRHMESHKHNKGLDDDQRLSSVVLLSSPSSCSVRHLQCSIGKGKKRQRGQWSHMWSVLHYYA